MNKVCLVGRITAKPELRYTNTNIEVCRFTLAINRHKGANGEDRGADFINCIAWRGQAKVLKNYCDKGSQIGIVGHIQTGSFTDEDGNRRYTTDVMVENLHLLSPKNQTQSSPYDYQEQTTQSDPFSDFGENVSIDDNFLD